MPYSLLSHIFSEKYFFRIYIKNPWKPSFFPKNRTQTGIKTTILIKMVFYKDWIFSKPNRISMISNRISNRTKPTTHNRLKPPVKLSLKFNGFLTKPPNQTNVKFLKCFFFLFTYKQTDRSNFWKFMLPCTKSQCLPENIVFPHISTGHKKRALQADVFHLQVSSF